MPKVQWGIIGPGDIAANFAQGLAECESGSLLAIASRTPARRESFGDRFGVAPGKRYDSYEALCADPEVGAVHIATPHPFHAEQALMAIRAGKHVSVEKPMALNEAEATAIVEAAREAGVFFREAYMYLHHPQIARMVEILREGRLGAIQHVKAVFGFSAGFDPQSRLYSRELAGGGILDVGGYPVSAARLIAGIGDGVFADPVEVKGVGHLGRTNVDEVAFGLLKFANGITAEISCAVARNLGETVEVFCENGSLRLANPWVPGRNAGPSDSEIHVTTGGQTEIIRLEDERILFAFEAEDASRAILAGETEATFPAMDTRGSIGNARVQDAWRRELGYVTFAEDPATVRRLVNVLPSGLPQVSTVKLEGVEKPVNRLIMGCDNRDTAAEGAVVWDAWMEAGGRTFDTAFVYGGGRHEAVLGDWIRSRGVADDVTVIVKGVHSPYCFPDVISAQLDISLDRLGLEKAPIYIMHRDNPDVPVGEFVEAVARERDAGRIGIWGGSNWSVERFAEAVEYANERGLEPPRVLNNNLSLAVMVKPVWDGCVTSNSPGTLGWMRENGIIHISWSSQARGYFLPRELRDRLPVDTNPETCFGGPKNEERRRRAETLAQELGVTPHNVATAWVLSQSFPSLALIGPRSPGEIATTLPALGVKLSPEQVAWLNLED